MTQGVVSSIEGGSVQIEVLFVGPGGSEHLIMDMSKNHMSRPSGWQVITMIGGEGIQHNRKF